MSETRTGLLPLRLPLAPVALLEEPAIHDKCARCGGHCCSYFALQIDTPRSYDEFDDIRWYVSHRGVQVYKEGRRWFLQVDAPCDNLSAERLCGIYEKRPKICADHSVNSCEFENDDPFVYAHHFQNAEEVEAYMRARWPKGRPRQKRKRRRALPRGMRFA